MEWLMELIIDHGHIYLHKSVIYVARERLPRPARDGSLSLSLLGTAVIMIWRVAYDGTRAQMRHL